MPDKGEPQSEPIPDDEKETKKPFDPNDTAEFEPLIEDPLDILKRGREERDEHWSPEERRRVEEDTKKLIIDNAKRRKERDDAKEEKKK